MLDMVFPTGHESPVRTYLPRNFTHILGDKNDT